MFVPDGELIPLLRDALARGQRVRMTVNGRSMGPFIRDGDVVEIAALPPALKTGAVVLAHLPGDRYPLHRLVAQQGAGWVVRGDNRSTPDGVVPAERLLGVATRVERNGRVRPFPLGFTGRCIGWLSRRGWLMPIVAWTSPRRVVRAFLRRLFG